MKTVFFIILVLGLGSTKTTNVEALATAKNGEPSPEELRLPKSLIPLKYDLRIKAYLPSSTSISYGPDLDFTFDGKISISMLCKEDVSTVTLNSVNLNISQQTVKVTGLNGNDININRFEERKELEMVLFHLDEKLKAGNNYTISMKYRGPIAATMAGFYRSHYMDNGTKHWLGVTQFQPTDARKTLPGFDEPHLKAVFSITIEHPSEFKALSNAQNISITPNGNGWTVTKFADSPKMSSYLVAWVICAFEYTEKRTKSGTLFRIWSRPSFLHQTRYAAEIGPKALEFFEDYYKIPFPLEKQDMIALPDFAAGAMENWGLVTYREKALLYDEAVYSLADKQLVTTVIVHELAHQWFGNLVTTKWWDDLWLNEGFATLMQDIGGDGATDGMFQFVTQFVTNNLQKAMKKDQMASSHPMLIYIGKAYDVYEIFDSISYNKGGTVIRMVMEVMGEKAFREGLTNYLTKYSYGSADHNDLWNSLSKTAQAQDWHGNKINISDFADPWTVQMGFPLVTVSRDYKCGQVFLDQERFKLDPNAMEKEEYRNPKYGYKWNIPLWYQIQNNETVHRDWLSMDGSKKLDVNLKPESWFLLNSGVYSYHRTNYDSNTWKQLAKQLQTNHLVIPVASRSQLVDDAFNLAKADVLDYKTALSLTKYLDKEESYVPWSTAISHLYRLGNYFKQTSSFGYVTKYMLKIMTSTYSHYGWSYAVPENDVLKQRLQTFAINGACAFGHAQCTAEARKRYNHIQTSCADSAAKLSSSCNKLQPHLRTPVYCDAIKMGGLADWEFLWEKYLAEDVAVEMSRIGFGLACSKTKNYRLLDEAVKGEKIRHQDTRFIFSNVARNPIGRLLLWGYLEQNWKKIEKTFGNSFGTMGSIISAATKGMSNRYQVSQLEHFMETHPADAKKYGSFKAMLENAKINADWMDRNFQPLTEWFKSQTESIG